MEIDKWIWLTTEDSKTVVIRKSSIDVVLQREKTAWVCVAGISDPFVVVEKASDIYTRLITNE